MRIPKRKVHVPGNQEKHIAYESEKAKLQALNIPYEEYERKVRELARKYRI
jgi:hypothetical protein